MSLDGLLEGQLYLYLTYVFNTYLPRSLLYQILLLFQFHHALSKMSFGMVVTMTLLLLSDVICVWDLLVHFQIAVLGS
jgi:hypothetical protein